MGYNFYEAEVKEKCVYLQRHSKIFTKGYYILILMVFYYQKLLKSVNSICSVLKVLFVSRCLFKSYQLI